MTRRMAVGGVALLGLMLLALWFAAAGGGAGDAATDREAESGTAGIGIAMREVDVRESRAGEDGEFLLRAQEADYRVVEKILSARVLTVSIPGRAGTVTVEAPEGIWAMNEARLRLPRGVVARKDGPWEASASSAEVDLANRFLTAPGSAKLRGPGFSVTGRNLAWRFREGSARLDSPRSRIEPGMIGTIRKGG